MPNPRKLRLHDIQRRADALATDIAHVIAYDAAVSMAHEERTGKPMEPETLYLPEDEERALEIMRLLPRGGA
jgi:hypothetical protein